MVIFVGDVGLIFRLTVVADGRGSRVDLSAASEMTFKFKRPDGTVFTKEAEWVTDGHDGLVQCTAEDDDLTLRGPYMVQLYLELGTSKWHTSMHTFEVTDHL